MLNWPYGICEEYCEDHSKCHIEGCELASTNQYLKMNEEIFNANI